MIFSLLIYSYIALANIYANIHDLGYAGDPFPKDSEIEKLIETTGLEWEMLSEIADDVEAEIQKAQVFLQT